VSVCIAVVRTRTEAEIIAGMLRTHGIEARVSGDDAGGMRLELQAQGVRVLVPDDDAAEASQLVDEGEPRPARSSHPLNGVQRWLVRLLGQGGRA
jgi:hypothetical protein